MELGESTDSKAKVHLPWQGLSTVAPTVVLLTMAAHSAHSIGEGRHSVLISLPRVRVCFFCRLTLWRDSKNKSRKR